jgi:tetratricopeptide (TPR) repeat protein
VARQSRAGRKLEVRFRDGRIIKGSTYKLDPNAVGFHLVPLEPIEGSDRLQVNFSDLTAIHVLRDFSGGADSAGGGQEAGENSAEGEEIKVAFRNGDILEGYAMHRFDPDCRRLFIVPKESVGGSISILVERSALKGLEIEGFREGTFAAAEDELSQEGGEKKKTGRAPLSQNETMGDLYFSMKNYDSALAEYDKIRDDFPDDKRLGMKIAVCNFNRGVNFVKSRKYVEAKAEFEKISKDDPVYGKAKKKIRKIEKVLKDAETLGG